MVDLAEETFAALGDYRAIIDQWLDLPRVRARIAVEGGRRVGFVIVAQHRSLGFWRPVTAELVAIVLEPWARGRGLGSHLLRAAEDEACAFEAREMRLHTAHDNVVARALFETAGYEVRDGRSIYYPNGQPALELRRPLE